jgi:AraC-like DNA-binding protein
MTVDTSALAALGLDDRGRRAYQALALDEACDGSVEDVARHARMSRSLAAEALERLVELGLAVRDVHGTGYAPSPVEAALDALVAERREELARAEAVGKQLALQAARIQERRGPEQLVGVINGSGPIRAAQLQLMRSARTVVRTFDRPPYVTPTAAGGSVVDPLQAGFLAAGLRYRTVYDSCLLDDPVLLARIRAEVSAGEEGRVLPELPLKMLISDESLAIVPLLDPSADGEPAALLVRPSVLLDSLISLFEALWRAATPVVLTAEGVEQAGDDLQVRQLVELLGSGLTEERLARLLGISERTVRRRLTAARETLGVSTMFQAGVAAARRGWV